MSDLGGLLPEDLDGRAELLEKFGGEDGAARLAKSYLELEKFRGRSVAIPESGDDEEAWAGIMAKLGAPGSPEGYKIPEAGDVDLWAGLAEEAASAQLTQRQFDTLAQRRLAEEPGADPAEALKEEYGAKYDTAFAKAKRAAAANGVEDGWESDPRMFKLLEKVGSSMVGQNPNTDGPPAKTSARKIAGRLREVMASAAYSDSFHPEHESAMAMEDRLRMELREAGYSSIHDPDLTSPYSPTAGFNSAPWENPDTSL